MQPQALFARLFTATVEEDGSDLRTFLQRTAPDDEATAEDPFARLVQVARHADRRAAAVVAGHQAAMRRLFPGSIANREVAAFCVSEEHGAHPRHIATRLEQQGDDALVLTGSKKWATLSPDADLLMVAASLGEKDGRNDLRMVVVPAGREGVAIEPMPTHFSVPELRHAELTFNSVAVSGGEVLRGDGYRDAIKPFRLVEDTFNTAAVQVALLALGLRHGWPEEVLEDLLSAVLQAEALSRTGMEAPAEVLAISAYLRQAHDLWQRLEGAWKQTPAETRARWSPETGLLGVAARAREMRRQRAWEALLADA